MRGSLHALCRRFLTRGAQTQPRGQWPVGQAKFGRSPEQSHNPRDWAAWWGSAGNRGEIRSGIANRLNPGFLVVRDDGDLAPAIRPAARADTQTRSAWRKP